MWHQVLHSGFDIGRIFNYSFAWACRVCQKFGRRVQRSSQNSTSGCFPKPYELNNGKWIMVCSLEKNFPDHWLKSSQWCWYNAVKLIEDLENRGLRTASSIQRACHLDDDIMWRFVSVASSADFIMVNIWSRFRQVITYCEYYRPFFKRYRVRYSLMILCSSSWFDITKL